MTIIIIYLTVGVAAFAALVLAILNWISAGRAMALIADLEKEIEKKALEFDAIRKERSGTGPIVPSVDFSATDEAAMNQSPLSTASAPASYGESSEIQIFRNVRGSFSQSSPSDNSPAHYDQTAESGSVSSVVPVASVEIPPHTPYPVGNPLPGHTDSTPVVAAVEMPLPTPAVSRPDDIIVPVYSENKKDADFDTLSVVLRQRLPQHPSPRLTLDFSRIFFLYEQELDYLNKLEQVLRKRNGVLTFINCEGELRKTLQVHPALAACLQNA